MAYAKKRGMKKSAGLARLKLDLSEGTIGSAYLFYGEESYLREHYLTRLRETLVPEAFSAFNYHRVEGKDLTVQALSDMAEAMPMMAERTMIVVVDYDLFRLGADQREKLAAFLADVPEYCCLVFVYDTIEFKPNRTMKNLCAALDNYVAQVEFHAADHGDLVSWVSRRFQKLGKEIDRQNAEYLIFTCGDLMTGLIPEIEKIAAFAKGKAITLRDIDEVADPILSTEVFRLSDAVLKNDFDRAAEILGELLKMQTEPISILAALGSQLRRIYTARLGLDGGKGKGWLMELWGMKSDYPAKLLLSAARHADLSWCADAVRQCEILDRRMKSETGIDDVGELKLLLMRLGAGRR